MVQLMGSFHFDKVEDFVEEEYGPLAKRSRFAVANLNQLGANHEFLSPTLYNPLDEPSPLGLRLKKSPSLLDLIQMRLSQGSSASVSIASCEVIDLGSKTIMKGISASSTNDKLKASNFPASVLRIGNWEYISKYEGDLVVKCYFAKHKLVWEVLEGGLKSKIEIQWSDITALKADCPDDGPGSLTIVLARKPTFFRETNPQPRKHTLWQATPDFTDGQASINKKHFIQCPPGVLNKHYEKLIQCDVRLSILCKQLEIVMESPYFESKASADENPDESTSDGSNAVKGSSPVIDDVSSTTAPHFSPFKFAQIPLGAKLVSKKEAPSHSSVMDACAIEGNRIPDDHDSKGQKSSGRPEVPGLHPSMSISDFVNHIGNHISEQITSGSLLSEKASECQDMLENIAQVLLTDTQPLIGLDEKSLLKKVDSLCCLLQDPVVASSSQVDGENFAQVLLSDTQPATCMDEKSVMKKVNSLLSLLQEPVEASGAQVDGENQYKGDVHRKNVSFNLTNDSTRDKAGDIMKTSELAPGMQPKDSDLLLHLPRIVSLPKFLIGITENDEYQAI